VPDVQEILPSVYLIDTHFMGQSGVIGAYLLTGPNGEAALLETGPSSTQGALLEGIRAAGVAPADIRDVLVTHIHLDHAGGAGTFVRDHAPRARVHVHPVGLPHLIDPSRLERSAARLYGDMMGTLWGEIAPLPEDRAVALDDGVRLTLAGHEVEVLFTPGHAAHHVAVRHLATNAVFTGDVAGVRVPGAGVINPPTVPPEFDLEDWERSIDRLLSLTPSALFLIHYGRYDDARDHLLELRRRLRQWTAFVRAGLAEGRTPDELGMELQRRDAAEPGTSADGLRQLNLIAGYGSSVTGIARYLSRR